MSYTQSIYHVVIRTRGSRPSILPEHERELYAYLNTFLKAHHCLLYRINGMPDHVHMLLSLHPTIALASLMRDLKTASSKFMRATPQHFPLFEGWESEYYAASLGASQLDTMKDYIIQQKEHHSKLSFREELLSLCREQGISVNEHFV